MAPSQTISSVPFSADGCRPRLSSTFRYSLLTSSLRRPVSPQTCLVTDTSPTALHHILFAMFDDNFSFATSSRTPSLVSLAESSTTEAPTRSVSPCSPALPDEPTCPMAHLAAQFASQRIRRDAHIIYDSCDAYAATDDDAGWTIDEPCEPECSRDLDFTLRSRSSSQRAQRQLNARLLCSSTAHQRDIAQLVTRMVETGDQCAILPSGSCLASSPTEDEGYDSDSPVPNEIQTRQTFDYRRASDMRSSGISVSKTTRFRKARQDSRKKSGDKH